MKTLYRFFLYPFSAFIFRILAIFNGKVATGYQLRKSKPWLQLPAGERPIWFHCASGEFEYAKPVIREIKKLSPEQKILVTYFSPSSQKNIESFADVDMSTPLPFDTASSWKIFLDHHQPKALLVARTDIWPEMIWQTSKAKIPIALFSATLASSSGRLSLLARPFYSKIMKDFDQVFCVTGEDEENYSRLAVKSSVVSGDTRYDQVFSRLENPKEIRETSKDKVFIAGSTWPEDEEVIIPALKKASMATILAPHEPSPSHIESLRKKLDEHDLSHCLYSKKTWEDEDVMIVDQVGILAELYTQAHFAFVGGSFRKTVHSVMEPLAAGCLTFVGPFHQNNREALEFKTKSLNETFTVVNEARSSEELSHALSAAQNFDFSAEIRSLLREKKGASGQIANWALQTNC